jgi:hypothetical protein
VWAQTKYLRGGTPGHNRIMSPNTSSSFIERSISIQVFSHMGDTYYFKISVQFGFSYLIKADEKANKCITD